MKFYIRCKTFLYNSKILLVATNLYSTRHKFAKFVTSVEIWSSVESLHLMWMMMKTDHQMRKRIDVNLNQTELDGWDWVDR